MKKLLLALVASCAVMMGFGEDDPLAGYTKYYWNKPDGGNWNTAANWVMADGTTATTYPQTATDAAIFNGSNPGKNVTIPSNFTNIVGLVYFEDGLTSLKFATSSTNISFHVIRFLREDHATMSFAVDGWNWTDPGDFVIDNREELLVDECIPGASWRKDDGSWGEPRSVTINSETFKVTHVNDSSVQSYEVSSSKTWTGKYSMLFGNWGDGRNISFKGDYILTVPSGQIAPLSASHVGTATSAYQGAIATSGGPVYFMPRSSGNNFRSLVQAPKFVQSSRYTTVYYDDHSSETCSYWIPQGTLQLGKSGAEDLTATCVLGTNEVNVSWSGTLDVQCEGALEKVGVLHINSYRGRGENWGKVVMTVSDIVTKAYFDDKPVKAGVYGATGSGADIIDDVHFAGTGKLTIRKDDIPGLSIFLR